MDEPQKIWLRSIRPHTYWNIPRDPDTFYQVDSEQDAQTIVDGLKWAVRENPPAKATRPSVPVSPAPRRRPGSIQSTAHTPTT